MNLWQKHSGISLVETTLAIALGAMGLLFIAQGASVILKKETSVSAMRESDTELMRALADLMRVGRIAQTCARIEELLPPQPNHPPKTLVWLECRVDRNVPPTSDSTDDEVYRFGFTEHFGWWRKDGNVFRKFVTYSGITQFELCDDARMQSSACLMGDTITARHRADLASASFATQGNRFFRFWLVSGDKPQTRTIQSSFWVRHPTQSGLTYQWGSQWK